jgi:transitional endoplasmic reticulum ATPase
MEALAELGGKRTRQDDIKFGKGWQVPVQFKEDLDGAIDELQQFRQAQYTQTTFTRKFDYRPYDGAAALERVLKRDFGASFQIKDPYGNPPERRTINVGIVGDEPITATIPWGDLHFPWGIGSITTDSIKDRERGSLFVLHCNMQKRFEDHAEGLFKLVHKELEEHSLYRGKAINGAPLDPGFYDTDLIKPEMFIYTEEAWAQINTHIVSAITDADRLQELEMPGKRVVLFEGPYGTGKTGGLRTAMKRAIEHGWTCITARPGVDDPFEVLQTAALYAKLGQRVLVLIEDIDTFASGQSDPNYTTKLLDKFDGIGTKTMNMVLVMTTNHVDKIHKGMMRPGRLDAVIHIGAMDRPGVEALTRMVLGDSLAPDVDFDAVFAATEGFMPAFVREAIDGAVRYAIAQHGDVSNITTGDLIRSCEGLYNQLNLQNNAVDVIKPLPELEEVFSHMIETKAKADVDYAEVHRLALDAGLEAIETYMDKSKIYWEDEEGDQIEARLRIHPYT